MRTVVKVFVYPIVTVGVLAAVIALVDEVTQRRRYRRAGAARAAYGQVVNESEHDADSVPVPVAGAAKARRNGLCEAFMGMPIDDVDGDRTEPMATIDELDQLRTALTMALTGVAPVLRPPGGYSRLDVLDGLGSRQ